MKQLLLISAFFLICTCARSQCTNVCIKSGTITTTGTVTVSAKGSYTASTTYSYVTSAGTNTIASGALSVAVANVGSDNAIFNSSTIPPGAVLNIEIPNATLPSYTYNCLTSTLLILVNR